MPRLGLREVIRAKPASLAPSGEAGFTLIELIVVLAILPLVIGGVAMALLTSFRDSAAVQTRIADSHDAQITSAYFVRDVQTATEIETSPTPLCSDPSAPGPTTQLMGLAWPDTDGAHTDVVSYVSTTLGATRSVTDGVTNSSTTITSATAQFTARDIGSLVGGSSDIPVGAFIVSVTDATSAVLSLAATGTDTAQTFQIGTYPTLERWFCQAPSPLDQGAFSPQLTTQVPPSIVSHGLGETRTVPNGVTTSSTKITSTAGFSSFDVGSFVTSPDIPAGTSIVTITDPNTAILSAPAMASHSGQTFQLVPALAILACNQYYDTQCATDAAAGLVSSLDVSTANIVVSNGSPRRFSFSLDAVPRIAQYTSGASVIGSVPPLELLGSGASCTTGSGSINVYGTAAVDSSSAGSLQFNSGKLTAGEVYSQNANTSGSNVPVSPPDAYAGPYVEGPVLANPFQNLPQPNSLGVSTYTYSSGVWTPPLPSSQPSTLSTFVFDSGAGPGSGPLAITDLDNGTLYSGVYIFSGDVTDMKSDPGGVFLDDLAHGSIAVTGSGKLNVSALTSPPKTPYTGIAFLAPYASNITMTGNGSTDALDGLVIAPSTNVTLAGSGSVDVLGLVASTVSCTGNGGGAFGPQPSDMTLLSSVNPSQAGQMVNFTATVNETKAGNVPTGTVTFQVTPSGSGPSVPCANVPLDAGGSASCSISTLVPSGSPYNILATYVSDTGADQNRTADVIQYVPYVTTTSVSGPGPLVSGQSAIFTATVAAGATPVGSVTFKAKPRSGPSVTLCSSVPVASGTAQCMTTALVAAGSRYTITAAFTPTDPDSFVASSDTTSETVTTATTTIAIASSTNPSVYGQKVTYSATLSVAAPGSGTPSGTVTFNDGLSPIACSNGSQTFDGATATCIVTYNSLSGSPHQIFATYSGDTSYMGSTSSVLSQVVSESPTTTSVSSSRNPRRSGRPVTFTATVVASGGGTGTPSGTVTFTETPSGSVTPVVLCSNVSLSGGGNATCNTSSLVSGQSPYTITATFTDTDGFFLGSSGTLSQRMN